VPPSETSTTGTPTPDWPALRAVATEAMRRAYAPYSRFPVGVAGLVDDGRVVSGCNVENASYGLTLCAERAALAAACQLGAAGEPPKVTAVAVVGLDARPGECMPCGACRQWLAELAPEADYYVEGVEETLHLDDLLPRRFTLDR